MNKWYVKLGMAVLIILALSLFILQGITSAQVKMIKGVTNVRLDRNVPIDKQLHDFYIISHAGDVQYVTESVYVDRVLELNHVSNLDALSLQVTIEVPWNQ